MVLGDMMDNLSELISILPVEVSDKVLELIVVLKALGIAAIAYIVYVVVIGFLTYRRIKKVDHIEKKADAIGKKVDSIDRKLGKLLKKG